MLKLFIFEYMLRGSMFYEFYQLIGYWKKTLSSSSVLRQCAETISFGTNAQQYLVHFSPEVTDPTKPLIIYYHGGGWIFGKPELFARKAAVFTSLGYHVVMPAYRKVPRYHAGHMQEDIALMLEKLKVLSIEGKIPSLDRIILGGVSAGANLASLIYFKKEILANAGFSQSQFIGMFMYAPPLDLSMMRSTPVLYRFAGSKKSKRFYNTSPINFITDSKAIPILCVHGTKDGLVKHNSSSTFSIQYEKLYPGYMKYNTIKECTHIEVASWAHTDNSLRRELVAWLYKIS